MIMEFKIIFYKDEVYKSPIEEFLLRLGLRNRVLVSKTRKGIEKLRNKNNHREPLSKYLEQDLWELRIKSGTDILRIIYTFRKGQIIILLHVFIKKKQKIPIGELELARKRLREIKLQEVN